MSEVKKVARESTIGVEAGKREEMIVAKIPQGYETNINVRFVPGRSIDFAPISKKCRPRKGAPSRNADPLNLPPDLIEKLKKADKVVIAWLAKDEANAKLFLNRPAEALIKAGVDLTRAEQKTIDRTHHEVHQATVVGPGVKVASLTATAYTRGRIGKIKPGAKTNDEQDDNIGCAKEK